MKKIFFIFLYFLPIFVYSQGGKSGLKFLLSYDSRLTSLGESFTTNSEGASAILGNPSGLLTKGKTNLELGIKQYIQNVSTQFLLAQTNINENMAIGFHILNTGVPDIEIRTRPGGPEGYFSSQDLSTGLSFAYLLLSDLKVGITAKYLYEKIFIDENSGFGIDFGANYKVSNEINLGCSFNNLGKMSKLKYNSTTLPATISIGSSYILHIPEINSKSIFILDIHDNIFDDMLHMSIGAEINYGDLISLRLGYITGYETKDFTAGIGIKYKFLNLDYSYVPFSMSFGDSHTITLGFEF